MGRNPPTQLSPREREALERLEQWFDGRTDTRAREVVVEHLAAGDFEHAQANRLLTRLLSKGYLYEVTEGIRLTKCE